MAFTNQLILADNLTALKELDSESVDLIYIDPPFNSNRNYIGKITDNSGKEILAKFEDTWRGGMKTYIHEFMYPIVRELHRVLKKTGSFYLHCDPTAQAYIQVEILDPVFGISNFRNEIIWCYRKWSIQQKQFASNHDVIFFYTKSKEIIFNSQFTELSEGTLKRWKGQKQQAEFDESGRRVANNLSEKSKGSPMPDFWEISVINPAAHERTGYPTQKPEKLLERIILASSNEGDVVLDCFLGSGTTIVTADRLNRRWIGIDHNPVAISVARNRLLQNLSLFNQEAGRNFTVQTKKYNYDELRVMDDFEFEKLMVNKLGGRLSKEGKGADKGIDGIFNEHSIISVKRWGKKVDRNTIDNLISAIRRYRRDNEGKLKPQKELHIKIQKGDYNLADYDGIIVAFDFTRDTFAEAVDLKTKDNFNILLLKVEDILPVAKPPAVKIQVLKTENKNYEFEAIVTSQEKLENYSWTVKRLNLKDSSKEKEILDTSLINESNLYKREFPSGNFAIQCEVSDENGLTGTGELEINIL